MAVLCAHCSLPVPRGLIQQNAPQQFCCHGCQAVYETLHAEGLEEYYRLRTALGSQPASAAATTLADFAAFDHPTFQAKHVNVLGPDLCALDLRLEGVHCAACAWVVERLPRLAAGVLEARLNLSTSVARVVWNPLEISLSAIAIALDRLGYPPHPAQSGDARQARQQAERRRLIQLGVAGALAGNTMLMALVLYVGALTGIEPAYATLFRWLGAALGIAAVLGPGFAFLRGAWQACRARVVTIDVPVALALVIGAAGGLYSTILGREHYFDSLSVLVFLLLAGRFLQTRQQRRAVESVELLAGLTPLHCHVLRGGKVVEEPLDSLEPGDQVQVYSGELLPADGVVLKGASSVNRAILTGESTPEQVAVGATVYAGTQNLEDTLSVQVTTVGAETRAGRLMSLVDSAIRSRPPIVEFADRTAGYFLVAMLVLATLTGAAWWWRAGLQAALGPTVALLIVACPCALGLATPLTFAIAIGRAARRGILIKRASALQQLARPGSLFIDKTGTLTLGQPTVIDWQGEAKWREIVAAVEQGSIHPIGRALAQLSDPRAETVRGLSNRIERGDGGVSVDWQGASLLVGSPAYLARHGVLLPNETQTQVAHHTAAGRTVVVAVHEGVVVALFALGDALRADAEQSLAQLVRSGWRLEILSGDAPAVVERLAHQLGVASASGALTPEDKLAKLTSESAQPPKVMLGDGVNDAAALAAADVGIAVHGGAEASLAAADVSLCQPKLELVVELMELAATTMRTAHRNLGISLSYNVLTVTLAAFGFVTPLMAAVLMPLSSLSVLTSAIIGSRTTTREQPPCR